MLISSALTSSTPTHRALALAADDMRLVDFRVRITGGGVEAVTRVTIDFEDGQGHRWSTVGVSANLVDASFEALNDGIIWKLICDGAQP